MYTLNGWTLWCVDSNSKKFFKNKNNLSYTDIWPSDEKGGWDRYQNFVVDISTVY